ncbi:citrate/sodium symporter CitN [Salmonella enterica subsp. enterica serovar Panama]|uniref:Citrate-sodium symporter n=2 Tax=Salmonella enterica TaxID=28901 RepID=A0A5H8API9_SALET|nr:citrate/sodium symporter CitN [Salmonella enterica subsp. enterica serovar Panama]ECK6378793.1 citrate/sodium symporter CitN [Salmonella enterica]EBU7826024.1 citrate/sodium symporter CitN [Salmonella enterica subsp. enterica serovar Panama]EBV5632188.1 citrate/sodium symporter CitN [Salmonella enterica subsp. enterica serovar Panama]EBW2155532.1 citrate/sodium symporter CitN [Salmonella enterica subsp. enterica serovar Panama]
MTNMTQASATERKGASDLLRFKIFGMPLPLYAFALITLLLSHFYNAIPTDLVGGFALMFVMGAIFGEIGKRLPIFNKYIGGAPVMIFLVAAYFVYAGIFTQKEIDAISNVMDKSNFLNLFIAVLITGAILSVNRKLLLKSLLGYIPTILAGIVGASLFGIVIGLCFGIPVDRIMMLYVLPIMGAVPLSEIYHSVTGRSREEYYSTAIAILTIANIFAIIFAALLDMVGKKYTWLSGEGELVRKASFKTEDDEKAGQITHRETAVGMVLSTTCFLLAYVVAKKILPSIGGVSIHYFAWMVLIVAALNASGLCSPEIKAGAKRLSDFFSKQLLWVLMVGVGVCYTDLQEIIDALTFANVVIAAIIVVGAVVGAAIGGWLIGFYPIESSITAGLCMANRGGSGDLEVLSACNRMNLISYAQISSRLGGGIVLVIASIVFSMMV